MTSNKSLLIELGTEELPVKALPELAQALFDGVLAGLDKRGIAYERGDARPLYTPRRLAVRVPAVALRQPDRQSEVLGPYLNIALDGNGQPTPALRGFAAKAGVEWNALGRISDGKGERFVHRATIAGVDTASLLPEIVREAIAAMPIPKPMRWGDHDFAFARPLHWLVLLLGDKVIDGDVFGIHADRMSRGHRFHFAKPVWIGNPDDYVEALRQAKVLVDPIERRDSIRAQVEAAAAAVGGHARISEDNLQQVNALTEWPRAITCSFEEGFLRVPQEALISTMEANQKFFPVLDGEGRLSAHFIAIANIESRDETQVRQGYERVIRPRFADAAFFFDADRKQGLAEMNDGLASVTYQQKLGSYADKVLRVALLAETIAAQVGVDPVLARRAADLSKADLQSRLVNEFPELQGIAGRYYAAAAGEPAEVAAAIDDAYMPRFGGDAIAPSPLGQVLAIAERLDTLAGGFAAGLKPSGNKDPFALRRNALGLARTIIEGALELDLRALLKDAHIAALKAISRQRLASKEAAATQARDQDVAVDNFQSASLPSYRDADIDELYDFILDRLRNYYAEQGVPPAHFEAVANLRPTSLLDFERRLKAIGEFVKLPEAEALAAANKRIGNILRKAEGEIPAHVERSRLREPAEIALAESVEAAIRETDAALAAHDYMAVLSRLAWLRQPVDAFFDSVMVMAEDEALRENRLALLKRLHDRFVAVADISQLASA
ncbi:MAG: glycine--tRNA ligase subunit beta [Xanthomonadaceae bacterium]|nr:glycine--tRNA ligase subunit beta [Xanthomonadaceae bacterium]MDP2186864.1 glycine--tRNA ligase subunit beta [Xanthomonadales bacterium]MDZ4114931.1 glycine--tRNA ligase subunit beta [Xanthomonadaceae bacterium]MDZ4377451.1 glycine--tRNA ligase subunit beta [Xanthomonadaceae bacterium]